MSRAEIAHGVALVFQFGVGLALLWEGADWVSEASTLPWAWSGLLALTGATTCTLSVLHGQVAREAVVAATVVSSLWTLAATLVFLRFLGTEREGVTLGVSAVAQIVGVVFLSMISLPDDALSAAAREAGTAEENAVLFERRQRVREYGALSSFVDPVSVSPQLHASAAPGGGGGDGASVRSSPGLSAVRDTPPRTPSPFGLASGTSPHRSSAAAMPTETPEVIRASYRELLKRYELDS